jgi:glycosyltransferase involved in cell wall biosynthesis
MVRVLDHANAVLIGCDSFRDEVVERLGTDPARFTIVPGAVDTGRFTPPEGGLAYDPPVMLYHGRVDARKGVLDLLEACRMLQDGGDRFRLLISGIGPTFDETAAAIVRLGLSDCVEMTGYVEYDAVPAVYRRASIFVSPTYAEGFSNTILEAMASRMAVVSCRSVGVVDCIRDGENGLLTEPGDCAGLADALRRVLRDGALRGRLADAALAECRRVYGWAQVGRQIMGVYADVAGEAPGMVDPALPMLPCRFRAEPHLL